MKHRHTCSELVSVELHTAEGSSEQLVAILEDISETGARLQLDRPIPAESRIRILCSNCEAHCEFLGQVVESRFQDELGYFAEVVFHPGTEWTPKKYKPQHMLDLSTLEDKAGHCGSRPEKCPCDGAVCPSEIISRVIEPFVPLGERVRAVGREVAKVCGSMDAEAAAECFHSLFRIPVSCRLFYEFHHAYRTQREKMDRQQTLSGDLVVHLSRMAHLLNSIPEEALRR
jgi:hypothetical protein